MSNNHRDLTVSAGQVSSVGIPFSKGPGFTIPLVQPSTDSNTLYVQRVDNDQNIIGFDVFTRAVRSVRLGKPYHVAIGKEEVYSLLDPNDVPYVGNRGELSPIIRKWVSNIKEPLLRMNFARFCGQKSVAKRAAHEAVAMKAAEFKSEEYAIRWFIDSVISAELVTAVSAAGSSSAGDDSLRNTRLAVQRTGPSKLLLEVISSVGHHEQSSNKNISREVTELLAFTSSAIGQSIDVELTRTRAGAPKNLEWGRFDSKRHLDNELSDVERRAEQIMSEISNRGRQEERLALVLDLLLSGDSSGSYVFANYIDRAVFAERAIGYLSEALSKKEQSPSDTEKVISNELPKLIRLAFPMQRGVLLLELAKKLGGYPNIAKAIRSITERSGSNIINLQRGRILHELDLRRSPQQEGVPIPR